MAAITQQQFDHSRSAISKVVRAGGWGLDRIEHEIATMAALLHCSRVVDGRQEKCKVRVDFAMSLEDTLARVAVHLKMKG